LVIFLKYKLGQLPKKKMGQAFATHSFIDEKINKRSSNMRSILSAKKQNEVLPTHS